MKPRRGASGVPAPVMVLTGIASVQIGNAWADSLFKQVGAGGAGLLRLAWAMIILIAIYRPRLTGRNGCRRSGSASCWPG